MLNKKESLLRRDQAVSWLWACRKAGFNRDVAQLIAKEVFDGFKYLNGDLGLERRGFQIVSGRLVKKVLESWSDKIVYYHTILLWLSEGSPIYLNGREATMDEKEVILEILKQTDCDVQVERDTSTIACKTFGDVLPLCPCWKWSVRESGNDSIFHVSDKSQTS
jgi:hypothetical protein